MRLQNWLLREDQPFKGTIIDVCDSWSEVIREKHSRGLRDSNHMWTNGFVGALRKGDTSLTLRHLPEAVEARLGPGPLLDELKEILQEFD